MNDVVRKLAWTSGFTLWLNQYSFSAAIGFFTGYWFFETIQHKKD